MICVLDDVVNSLPWDTNLRFSSVKMLMTTVLLLYEKETQFQNFDLSQNWNELSSNICEGVLLN